MLHTNSYYMTDIQTLKRIFTQKW